MKYPTLMMLDGELRATLSIARGLGKKGIPIIAGSHHPLHRTSYSRYVQASFLYPFPGKSLADAHRVILEKIKYYRPDVLMPVFDRGWEIFFAYQEQYEKYTKIVLQPGFDLYKVLTDKASLTECAKNNGLDVPMTFIPKTHDEALAMKEKYPYPVLLKAKKGVAGKGIENSGDIIPIFHRRAERSFGGKQGREV